MNLILIYNLFSDKGINNDGYTKQISLIGVILAVTAVTTTIVILYRCHYLRAFKSKLP